MPTRNKSPEFCRYELGKKNRYENNVWKSSHQSSSILFVNYRIEVWTTTYFLDTCFNTAEKLFSQAYPATFIPVIRFCYIPLCLRCKYDFSVHAAREPCVLFHSRIFRIQDYSLTAIFSVPVPFSASHKVLRVPEKGRPFG